MKKFVIGAILSVVLVTAAFGGAALAAASDPPLSPIEVIAKGVTEILDKMDGLLSGMTGVQSSVDSLATDVADVQSNINNISAGNLMMETLTGAESFFLDSSSPVVHTEVGHQSYPNVRHVSLTLRLSGLDAATFADPYRNFVQVHAKVNPNQQYSPNYDYSPGVPYMSAGRYMTYEFDATEWGITVHKESPVIPDAGSLLWAATVTYTE